MRSGNYEQQTQGKYNGTQHFHKASVICFKLRTPDGTVTLMESMRNTRRNAGGPRFLKMAKVPDLREVGFANCQIS
jgi:hypothetical protein